MRTCTIDGCDGRVHARGWCLLHYTRFRRHGDPLWEPVPRFCSIDGCERLHQARGLCMLHYTRWRHHGDPEVAQAVRRPRERYTTRHGLDVGETCIRGHEIETWDDLYVDVSCYKCRRALNTAAARARRGREQGSSSGRPPEPAQLEPGIGRLDEDLVLEVPEDDQSPCAFCGDPNGGWDGICKPCWTQRTADNEKAARLAQARAAAADAMFNRPKDFVFSPKRYAEAKAERST